MLTGANLLNTCEIILLVHFSGIIVAIIIESVDSTDSISKDERGFPLTQYITNGRISRAG